MNNRTTHCVQWIRLAMTTALLVGGLAMTAQAAQIGVPAATTGAGKTAIGGEVNVLMDRDISGGGEFESNQIFAKGSIGVDNRLDLDFRLGFADFEASPGGLDTDLGPAFGVGMHVTWANLGSNLKIGSVFQTTRIRAENSAPPTPREMWAEYDAALGVSLDLGGSTKGRPTQFGLVPYGGFAWSGVDSTFGLEDDAFGVFLGIAGKGQFNFGAELRLIDQTALSVSAGMSF